MGIKCHSSFVHYNMFHNSHSHGGNNYGSIFNITNNCGGGHTNFWGGLGVGLGFGLGNLFSSFMGGFGNMFSGFGMGGFGMGGFGGFGMGGLGWGGLGWGGFGGASSSRSKSSSSDYDPDKYTLKSKSCDCGCKDKDKVSDKDYSKINGLQTEANKLLNLEATEENLAKVTELLGKVNGYKLDDENLTPENKEHLENIKTQLEKLQKNWQDEINQASAASQGGQVSGGDASGEEDPTRALLNSVNVDPDNYPSGYKNVYFDCDENDLNKLTASNVIKAHDVVGYAKTGDDKVRDVLPNAEESPCVIADSGKKITLKDKNIKDPVEYNYIGKTSKGQLLYQDKSSGQLYFLQKTVTDPVEYHLIQYDGMTGSGEKAQSTISGSTN